MANKTLESLKAYWNEHIRANGKGDITGTVMNTAGIDILDSMKPYTPKKEVVTGNFVADSSYRGCVVVWGSGNDADAVVTLPNNLPTDFSFKIINGSIDYKLTFSGTIIPTGANIKPQESAWIYYTGGYWFVSKVDNRGTVEGLGGKYNHTSQYVTLAANTWTLLPLGTGNTTIDFTNVTDVVDGIRITDGSGGYDTIMVDISASVTFRLTTQYSTRIIKVGAGTSAQDPYVEDMASYSVIDSVITDLYLPVSVTYSQTVTDNNAIQLFINSSTAETLNIENISLNIKYKSL